MMGKSSSLTLTFVVLLSLSTELIESGKQYADSNPEESWAAMKQFEASPYFLPPFDATLGTMAPEELATLRAFFTKVFDFYKTDVSNYLQPPARKFGMSFIKGSFSKTNFYCNTLIQIMSLKVAPELPLHQSFVSNLDQLYAGIMTVADQMIETNQYTSENVDKAKLLRDFLEMSDYLRGVLMNSPVGIYLQWEWLDQSKNLDDPENHENLIDRVELMADIAARLKVTGYFRQLEYLKWAYDYISGAPKTETGTEIPQCPVMIEGRN